MSDIQTEVIKTKRGGEIVIHFEDKTSFLSSHSLEELRQIVLAEEYLDIEEGKKAHLLMNKFCKFYVLTDESYNEWQTTPYWFHPIRTVTITIWLPHGSESDLHH